MSTTPRPPKHQHNAPRKRMSPARRRKVALWSFLTIIGLSLALPLVSYTSHWMGFSAVAQEQAPVTNNRSNYWRAVRDGVSGYSSVKGEGASTLVLSGGNEWRELRGGPIQKTLPWLIVGMLGLVALYHLVMGRNKLDHELSGRKVKRWSGFERLVHWFTAITFLILAVTGLSMLLGQALLVGVLGFSKAGFASWASLSITVHNIVGPAFSIGILLMIVMWIWHNFPTTTDLKWLAKGGGMFGGSHPSAGRMNAGEKIWFWLIMTAGVAVCISGFILIAPIYGFALPDFGMDPRALMQQSSLIHAALAIIWTAVAIGHIYIGTAGTEGAFEGMATGYVSEEWARQHHDLWLEELEKTGDVAGYVDRTELEIMRREQNAGAV